MLREFEVVALRGRREDPTFARRWSSLRRRLGARGVPTSERSLEEAAGFDHLEVPVLLIVAGSEVLGAFGSDQAEAVERVARRLLAGEPAGPFPGRESLGAV